MAMVGSACGGMLSPAAGAESCCHGCQDVSGVDEGESPIDPERSHQNDCPSCPSCKGPTTSALLNADAKPPTMEQDWSSIATPVLAVYLDSISCYQAVRPNRPSWWRDPPFVNANRDALRWHCALIL